MIFFSIKKVLLKYNKTEAVSTVKLHNAVRVFIFSVTFFRRLLNDVCNYIITEFLNWRKKDFTVDGTCGSIMWPVLQNTGFVHRIAPHFLTRGKLQTKFYEKQHLRASSPQTISKENHLSRLYLKENYCILQNINSSLSELSQLILYSLIFFKLSRKVSRWLPIEV